MVLSVGNRGSTAEHLDVLDFKIQQDAKRLDALDEAITAKEQTAAQDKKLTIQTNAEADLSVLDNLGKRTNLVGQIIVTPDEVKDVKKLAREGSASRGKIYDLEFKLNRVTQERDAVIKERDKWKNLYQSIHEKVKPFLDAVKHAPRRVMEVLAAIMREPAERTELERVQRKTRQEAR